MECLKDCRLIAGFEGYNNVITRVNIMADPDIIYWVSEGELLLTTAYFFKTAHIDEQIQFIKELSKRNLSGIAIKIYPYLERLPREVIDLANHLKFPIIELDYQIPFTDIITPIFKEIFNKQASLLQKIEDLHENLMNIILTGGGVKDIITTLIQTVGNPILIKNHYFEDFIYGDAIYPWSYEELENKIEIFLKNNINNKRLKETYSTKLKIDDKMLDTAFIPIKVKSSVYGYIIVIASEKSITNFDIVSIETASAIIAVESLRRISIQEVENRYKAEFFEDLISFDKIRKNKAIERALYYNFDKQALYNIVTIHFSQRDLNIENQYDFDQYKNKAIHIINSICSYENTTFLATSKGSTINILFMWKNGKDLKSKIDNIVTEINKKIKEKMNLAKYKIGIGRPYEGLENAFKSLKDAEKAIEAGKKYVDAEIIDFDELGIYKIFCQDNLKEELMKFYRSTLMPFCEYDTKRNTELVRTLEVYFETNGNLKKMSQKLFTHYNTILYRINRICEITDMDLNDEHDRFSLETALKIKKMMGNV